MLHLTYIPRSEDWAQKLDYQLGNLSNSGFFMA